MMVPALRVAKDSRLLISFERIRTGPAFGVTACGVYILDESKNRSCHGRYFFLLMVQEYVCSMEGIGFMSLDHSIIYDGSMENFIGTDTIS